VGWWWFDGLINGIFNELRQHQDANAHWRIVGTLAPSRLGRVFIRPIQR